MDLDEFRQAMIKTMAGKGEVVSKKCALFLCFVDCRLHFQPIQVMFMFQPDDNQLAIIFMKVDANCDGTVDWVR